VALTPSRIVLASTLALQCAGASAAEWAIAPFLSWDADTQSNRALRTGDQPSQAVGASIDLTVVRRTETSEFTLAPHYNLQRFTDDVLPDVDDQMLSAGMRFDLERGTLNFGAQYSNQSTLTTELAETGVVLADAARETRAADAAWGFYHSDAQRLDVSTSFEDVDYNGAYTGVLFGYRFGSYSIGETRFFSPRVSLSASLFGTRLDSPERGSESREQGLSLGMNFSWSELTSLQATVGRSRRDIHGAGSRGATGTFALIHKAESHEYSLNLSHKLVPFGTGVLTEHDDVEFLISQDLQARLRGLVRAGFARNKDAGFGFTFDSRTYRYINTELLWQAGESWVTSLTAGYASASELGAPESIGGWSLGLRMNWTPARHVFGH
jgi:hypothetical protein